MDLLEEQLSKAADFSRPGLQLAAMNDFLTAIGLLFVVEGVLYAVSPQGMHNMMRRTLEISPTVLRVGGVVSMCFGVFVVWLIRG